MIDILLYGLLGLAAAALLYNFIRRIARSRSDLGIEGKLIWMDKGRSTKPFFNQVFEVLGKPESRLDIFTYRPRTADKNV